MGIKYPIIGAPMFLVSNEDMVIEVSNAGGLGTFPALNFRPTDRYADAIKKIKKSSDKPIGVNIIVNKSNRRQSQDLKIALDNGVDLFVTSLGNPKTVIEEAHKIGAKVICDVTNLEHAKKVEDLGADGVVAVSAGAGGHAGPTNPFVLIPWLKKELHIPIIAAGGVAHGSALLAALALGASAVHVGTRFIASTEASIPIEYKNAIIDATPDDIILTPRITGTPATYINNEYLKSLSKDLPFAVKWLKENPRTKKYIVPLVHYMGYKIFEKAISSPHKAPVWSAGQSSGLVNEILPCKEIIDRLVTEFWEAKNNV
ncbi:MAG: nitronate monooxygenase [Bdellovibrionales bacterium]|nr:nitronate monooxygenase [Bdellovibrionales bacterium]